jgi:spoIIIJ-associated protein
MWEDYLKGLIERLGFRDYRLEVREPEERAALFIYENENFVRDHLARIVEAMNHIVQMVAKKRNVKAVFLDVNNYRLEREKLIADLAHAAAKKASQTREAISLPSMNSYERRLVHTALAVHPAVTTESIGEGKERYVVVKPIEEVNSK